MPRQFQRQPPQQAPPQQAPPPGKQNGGSGNKPATSFRCMVGSTSIEASVWANENQGQNGQSYTQFSVSLNRSYVDDKGVWHSERDGKKQSYRPQELPVAVVLLQKAFDWILSERMDVPV